MWFRTKVVYVCTPVRNVHQCYGGKHNPECSMRQTSVKFFPLLKLMSEKQIISNSEVQAGHFYVSSAPP